jgi:UPF0716 protein FxsA
LPGLPQSGLSLPYLRKADFNSNESMPPMPFLLFFLVISLPVIEVATIIEVSRLVGPFVTFLLLAASAVFGAFLIRSQSLTVGRRVMEAMGAGTPPEEPLLESASIMFAGVLFMIPGFFSDFLALLLLLPEARRLIWRGISLSMRGRAETLRTKPRTSDRPAKPKRSEDVIDVEFTEVPRERGEPRHDSPWGKP